MRAGASITAAIGDGPDAPVAVASDFGASLIYASAEAHAARVSADVEALRSLPGLVQGILDKIAGITGSKLDLPSLLSQLNISPDLLRELMASN